MKGLGGRAAGLGVGQDVDAVDLAQARVRGHEREVVHERARGEEPIGRVGGADAQAPARESGD